MKPRSINIFLLDGDPNGIRVAQISMSTIQAIAFRRNQLRRVRQAFPEIERPGVYILIGTDEEAQDRQLAYIGESEGVGGRLSNHNSNETGSDAKGFWTDTVALISKDENLTKSHARYVEACLIRGVGSNPRWSLPNNTQTPANDAGKLPLPDRAAMDEFVDQTKTLVGALGWDLFREIRGQKPEQSQRRDLPKTDSTESPRFFFRGDGFAAEMEISPSGDFVVTAGSRARIRTTRTIPRGTLSLRKTLVEKGVLREEGDFLVFTSAYSFRSASAAAAAVIGASANGRILWKLPDGRTYADWEANQDAIENPPAEPLHPTFAPQNDV
ncbi:GIY-YIG nuclease family protein [Frigidibacter sp. ROC022]|uniref:GIY-YIG nuclease family protein n=1 Tax=Frigidibacter sp. ROC022 TaxID=2971796 RepID=UPI00215A59FD|nr:GIY-YIG nuclease family protein [Frigidibacter sp. ROC022]MCR8724113.1 GIY-YIG nuclease family protein [Frigidibacter sp. ROC022]